MAAERTGEEEGTDAAAAAPRRRESLRDLAYEAIKRRILSCELRPGETVTVTELAGALGLGRTPVIQAIDRLAVDGLLEVMPRKGVVVAPVSLDAFVEIVEVRLLNETHAARWAAEKATRADLAEMEENVAASWTAARARDIDALMGLDREFHRIVSRAAGNAVLAEILGNLHDRAMRFWFISLKVPDHNLRVCAQHAAILEAMAAGDPDAAEESMRAHIRAFHANVTGHLLRA